MSAIPKGKTGTKSQKQIHSENQETVTYYGAAAAAATVVVGALYSFVFSPIGYAYWITWFLTASIGIGAVIFMTTMTRCVKNDKGQVIDAGVDINSPTSFGEYAKDAVILAVIAQVLSIFWSYFIYLILAMPAYVVIKLWSNVISPWIFAPAPEEEPVDEKKLRKQQRTKYGRR
uniref:Transmembrane protein 208 n=1 Tax=Panagrellus redivivus TaxID=6233 RepID=A0A7E4ZXB1_PANRE